MNETGTAPRGVAQNGDDKGPITARCRLGIVFAVKVNEDGAKTKIDMYLKPNTPSNGRRKRTLDAILRMAVDRIRSELYESINGGAFGRAFTEAAREAIEAADAERHGKGGRNEEDE